jgi:ankyrin repeat protein
VGVAFNSASAAQLVFEANLRAGGAHDAPVSPTALGDVTALHAACRAGVPQAVELLLQTSGCSMEARDSFGRTPLAYSVLYGRHEVAKLLVKRGAVDGRDATGHTSLQLLRRQSTASQDFELAALLSKSS